MPYYDAASSRHGWDGEDYDKRAIQRLVQDPLALRILDGSVLHGDRVKVDAAKDGTLKFSVENRTA